MPAGSMRSSRFRLSAGKGNLILQDFGKHAYTFIDRKSNRAIRPVQRPEPVIQRIDPIASHSGKK